MLPIVFYLLSGIQTDLSGKYFTYLLSLLSTVSLNEHRAKWQSTSTRMISLNLV